MYAWWHVKSGAGFRPSTVVSVWMGLRSKAWTARSFAWWQRVLHINAKCKRPQNEEEEEQDNDEELQDDDEEVEMEEDEDDDVKVMKGNEKPEKEAGENK